MGKKKFQMQAATPLYRFTGVANTFSRGFILTAAFGSYSFSSVTAVLTAASFPEVRIDTTSYTFTGNAVTFQLSPVMVASTGVYSFSSVNAGLGYAIFPFISPSPISYTFTGEAATLSSNITTDMPASTGAYSFSFQSINFIITTPGPPGSGTNRSPPFFRVGRLGLRSVGS